jgi:hypothetical protein
VTIAPREDKQPGGPRLKQLLQQGARAFGSQALKQVEDEVRRHGGTILNAVLEKQPVYKLRAGDTKHDLARLVLDKIEVREQTLLATLNPFRK